MEVYNMKTKNETENITIVLSNNEAIVLLEWLHNFNEEQNPSLFQDQAEERVLFDLEAELEKVVSVTLEEGYQKILLNAREQIRDVNG